MKSILFLIYILHLSFSFYHLPKIHHSPFLHMNSKRDSDYTFSKEYYEFYQTYKKPSGLLRSNFVNYKQFAQTKIHNYNIFTKNYQLINKANLLLQQNNNSFSIGLNYYSDEIDMDSSLPSDLNENIDEINSNNPMEFSTYFKFLKDPYQYIQNSVFNKKFSWNDTNYLSPVKNQGQCGSCWAFSTTTVLETFMRIHNFSIDRLSEQQLVDCSSENHGCQGGLMHTALEFIIDNKGLVTNSQYTYKATDQTCLLHARETPNVIGSNITDYQFVIPKSIPDFKNSVIQSPVCIAVDANNVFFRFYKEGIIDLPTNYSKSINHAVTLVGFDHDEKGMFWIIQNSWGTQWGENGFCKIRTTPGEGVLLCQKYGVFPVL